MIDFFKTLFSYWQGLLIGVVVGAIICVLIGKWIYQDKIVGSIFSVVICLVFSICGFCLQKTFFSKGYTFVENELIYDVVHDDSVDYINREDFLDIDSLGSHDRLWVEEHLKTAETTEDKYSNIDMAVYKEIVIFSRNVVLDGKDFVMNAIFIKGDNDTLIFDGCMNISVKKISKATIWFWTWGDYDYEYVNEMGIGNNFTPLRKRLGVEGSAKYYLTTHHQTSGFLCGDDSWSDNSVFKTADIGNTKVYQNYFQQLGDVGLILSSDKSLRLKEMNNFYTSLYQSCKSNNAIKNCVNVTNSTAYYKTSEDKLYKCNLFLNVNYNNYSNIEALAIGSFDNNRKNEISDNVDKEVITFGTNSYVNFKLNPMGSYNYNNLNLEDTPVVIKLKSTVGNKEYTLNFNNDSCLKKGVATNLDYGTYTVNVESDVLDFGKISNVTIDKNSSVVLFSFTYEYGTVLTTVRLNPLSNLALEDLDLETNPVTVTFNNGTSSYNFVFNNKETLNKPITQRLLLGDYTYSIQSEQLAFSSKTGTLKITNSTHSFVFNYDYKTNLEYRLSCDIYTDREMSSKFLDHFGFSLDLINCNFEKKITNIELFETLDGTLYLHTIVSGTTFSPYYDCSLTMAEYLKMTSVYQFKLIFEDGTSILTNTFEFSRDLVLEDDVFYRFDFVVSVV